MIENDILVEQGDIRGKQVSNGPHDAWCREVPLRVIIAAHHKNAGMVAFDLGNQVVKIKEIAVIAGEENTIELGGMR